MCDEGVERGPEGMGEVPGGRNEVNRAAPFDWDDQDVPWGAAVRSAVIHPAFIRWISSTAGGTTVLVIVVREGTGVLTLSVHHLS